jgi:hypothetical protein
VEAARNALEELEGACPRPAASAASAAAGDEIAPPPPGAQATSPAPAAAAASGRVPPAAPADSDTGQQSQSHALAWSLLGAGAASLTATVVLATYGAQAERDYEERARRIAPAARNTDAELRAIDERGHRSNRAALVLGVLSGLLTGTGATLWLTGGWQPSEQPDESASGLSLQLSPDGALSSYSGRF